MATNPCRACTTQKARVEMVRIGFSPESVECHIRKYVNITKVFFRKVKKVQPIARFEAITTLTTPETNFFTVHWKCVFLCVLRNHEFKIQIFQDFNFPMLSNAFEKTELPALPKIPDQAIPGCSRNNCLYVLCAWSGRDVDAPFSLPSTVVGIRTVPSLRDSLPPKTSAQDPARRHRMRRQRYGARSCLRRAAGQLQQGPGASAAPTLP